MHSPSATRTLLGSRRFLPLFTTQLLGAFNDNLFKSALVVSVALGASGAEGGSADALVQLASALLVLPFFLFSATAGQLADKNEKSRMSRALKIVEIAVMLLAGAGFLAGSLPLLFVSLFLMGAQSAFFGPIKYAILPQHVRANELVAANGLVEMGTFLAILGGTVAGGLFAALGSAGAPALVATLLAVAALGYVASRFIPEAAPGDATLTIDRNIVRATRDTLRIAKKDRRVWRAILGISWFWAFGGVLLASLPGLARDLGAADELTVTLLLTALSVGIGVGSVACDRLTRGRIALWPVPAAGLAMTLFTVDVAIVASSGNAALERILVDLFLLGVAGGVLVVPLYSLLTRCAAPEARSRTIAANNVVNAAFIVVAALFAGLFRTSGASVADLVLLAALLNAVVALGTAGLLYRHVLRAAIGAVVRAAYRVRVRDLSHIPDEGAALLVCNHPSFADAIIVGGLSPRPIRFVMDHHMYSRPMLRWLFDVVGAIPIAPRHQDPELLERAYDEIDRALADGELVCVFPEGKVTRDGEIDEFKSGVERILARRAVPVVPLALRGLWGSSFSRAYGPPMTQRPRSFFTRKVELVAGAAIVPERATAPHLRTLVAHLRGAVR
jgi:1-acyl-sn-glycerol-3-phosphate acyltransferase